MRNCILSIVLCLMVCLPGIGQEKKASEDKKTTAVEKKGPMSFDKFFKKDMKQVDATFPVYELDDKYYMEIAEKYLGRDMFISGQMVKGIGVRASGLESAGVVNFKKGPQDKLYMYCEFGGVRGSEQQPEVARILEEETLLPVDAVFPIVAWGKDSTGVIIEITNLIKGTGNWYRLSDEGTSAALKGNKQSGGGEMIFVNEVLKKNHGVKFTLTWIVDQNVAGIECHVDLLPERRMRVRYADERVGYETLDYYDFGSNPYGIKKRTIIAKWNLEPKDMNRYAKGILTEPKEPIVFYLDNCFPKELKKYAKEGVLEWQSAFEKAGFKNAIQVREAQNEDEMTSAKAVISYSINAGTNSTSFERDIRTGEILACNVNLNHVTLGGYLDTYFARCGAIDPRMAKNIYDPHVAGAIVRMFVARQVGFALGLLPNAAGSYAYTPAQIRDRNFVKKNSFSASILDDCSFNFIAQPEDKMTTDELIYHVGVYDRWAIEWGYRVFPNSKTADNDKKLLKNLADKRLTNKTLLYMKNTSYDLRALPSDLSSDKIEASRLGIRNMERFIKNLNKLSATEDLKANNWQTYMTGGQNALGMLYQNLVYKVMENLGSRMKLERDEVFASKELQQQTMEFLAENVFAEPQEWMYDEVLTKEFGIGPKGIRFGLQEIVFSYLLNPKVIENMERATRVEGDKAYSLIDYWGDIRRLIFKDFSKDIVLSEYECHVENMFIMTFMDLMVKHMVLSNNNKLTTYGVNMIAWINDIHEQAKLLSEQHVNQTVRDHYRAMMYRIEQDMKLIASVTK